MGDGENPPRGSSAGEQDRDLVYYYSREHRLSRSSPLVQSLYDGKSKRRGFFSNPANLMLFISIIIIVIMFSMVSRISRRDPLKLGGNTLAVSVQGRELPVLTIVKTAPKSGEVYIGAVEITVSPVMPKEGDAGEEITPFTHLVFFNTVDSEIYSIVLPFTGSDFFVSLEAGNERKTVRLSAGSR